MQIYYTSEFGDISIEKEEKYVILRTTELTVTEEELLKEILKKYDKNYKIEGSLENKLIPLDTENIEDVHKFMKKKLKKGKPTITAIKFKDRKIELSEELKDKEKIDKAVTVDKPRKGCPAPTFLDTEVRASKVLKEFLTEQQSSDFDKFRQFVSVGNYTGHNYIITSRWSPKVITVGQVYDLVEQRIICANCMEIPPAEEMLSLKFLIEFNEKEFVGL